MIRTDKLRKRYGRLEAVEGLELCVPEASIFGFIGPNGAGKTTTLRMLATLLRPSGGSFTIDGIDPRDDLAAVRSKIGYLSDLFGVYEELTVRQYLEYFAAAYLLEDVSTACERAISLVRLEEKRHARIAGLSRGMKQRVGIARALIHEPKVLLLDEPAGGLDPLARIELRDVLKDLRAGGTTVVVSSHILSELSDFCDTVGLIEQGRLIAAGAIEDILARTRSQWRLVLEVLGSAVRAKEILSAHPKVVNPKIVAESNGSTTSNAGQGDAPAKQETETDQISGNGDKIPVERLMTGFTGSRNELPELHSELVKEGVPLVAFYPEAEDLEDLFLRLSSGKTS